MEQTVKELLEKNHEYWMARIPFRDDGRRVFQMYYESIVNIVDSLAGNETNE